MNKEYIIQLTNNLYRLTILFPKKEPLRYKMRELADDILANLIPLLNQNPRSMIPTIVENVNQNLEVLVSYFEVAREQNWVSPVNMLAIQEEYDKLREEFSRLNLGRKDDNSKDNLSLGDFRVQPLVQRQQKILEVMKEKGKVQVWELKQIFPEVTKRTLRRDFEKMLNQGLIERLGERNETFYQIKNQLA